MTTNPRCNCPYADMDHVPEGFPRFDPSCPVHNDAASAARSAEAAERKASIPAPCRGETCTLCGAQATHKVAEEHLADGWPTHNHSAYVCDEHFRRIFQPYAETPAIGCQGCTCPPHTTHQYGCPVHWPKPTYALFKRLGKEESFELYCGDADLGAMILECVHGGGEVTVEIPDGRDDVDYIVTEVDAAAKRPTPEPPPPRSTAAAFDILRQTVEILRLVDMVDPTLAQRLEGAVDHVEALLEKLEADLDEADQDVTRLKSDIARLNEHLETYRKAFRHGEQWLRWIATEAEDCNVVRAPSDLSRHCAGIVSLVEPIPQEAKETPTP